MSQSFNRVARLAVMALGRPLASVTVAGGRHSPGPVWAAAPASAGGPGHDTSLMLQAGDSMILFTDGVTEARSHIFRELYGDDRLRQSITVLANHPDVCVASRTFPVQGRCV